MEDAQQLVAVVEDDASMRQALGRLLLASGFRTRLFDSADALLAAGGARDADCLLLDVQLPGASGLDLYHRLGSARPPVVFISGYDSPQLRKSVSRHGSALLPKPFLARELVEAITRAIQRA